MGRNKKKWNLRPMARLYHIAMSPYCRKVRLILAEKRIECELIEERYWERDPSFLRRNPAAKVPVLEIDGKIMSESAAICEYLEEKYPNPSLMPVDIHQRYEGRRLVGWFDDKFHRDVTSKLVYERVTKKIMGQGYPDSKNVKDGAKKIKYHLDYILRQEEQNKELFFFDRLVLNLPNKQPKPQEHTMQKFLINRLM